MKKKLNIHYAWIILFVCFAALLAVQGIRLSFGAFMQPWEKEFSIDRGMISLVSVLSFVFYGVSQPVIGKIIDKFGVRKIVGFSTVLVAISMFLISYTTTVWQLFVLYGIIASIGFGGVSNVATTVLITNWFNEKRGLAFGMIEAGFGAGQMIIVPSSLILISKFGWRSAVIYLAVFLLIIVLPLIFIFLKNSPEDKSLQALGQPVSKEIDENNISHEHKKISTIKILKLREFWFLILPFFVCGITTTGLIDTHFIAFLHDRCFSTSVTGTAVSVLAGFNVIGILLSGVLADKWDSRLLLGILYAIRTLTLFMLVYVHGTGLLFVFSVIFGISDFATVAPTQLLASRYFQNYSVGFVLGWLFLGHQIGSAVGSYLPGLLYSLSGGYEIFFYIAVALCLAASLASFALPRQVARGRFAWHKPPVN